MIGDPGTGDARSGPDGPEQPAAGNDTVGPVQARFEHFLSLSRLLALIPVVFLLFDAAASFIYGTDILIRSTTGLISEPAQVGGRLGVFLVVMDTFLVGATLLVSAFGFYELFIVRNPGRKYWLPDWLRMRDLEDLKARVVSMLILVVAITFVDRTVESQDEQEVLFLGLGISIIILALTFFLWFSKRAGPAARPDPVGAVADGGTNGGGAGGAVAGGPAGGGATGGAVAGGAAPASTAGSGGTGMATSGARPTSPAAIGPATARPAPRAALRLATAQDVPGGDGAEAIPPGYGAAAIPAGGRGADRPGGLAAILGVARRAGGQGSAPGNVLAVAGYARVDLRNADVGHETRIRANAVLGVISIVVPQGTRVAASGVAVLGLRLGGAMSSDTVGRRLVVSGLCLLGLVRVSTAGPQAGEPGIGSGWAADNRQIASESGPSGSKAS